MIFDPQSHCLRICVRAHGVSELQLFGGVGVSLNPTLAERWIFAGRYHAMRMIEQQIERRMRDLPPISD